MKRARNLIIEKKKIDTKFTMKYRYKKLNYFNYR